MSFKNCNQAIQRFISAQYRTPKYQIINAMLDARKQNTTIVEKISEISGKKRELKISYYPIQCDSVANDCSASICTEGNKIEPVQEYFNLSRCIQSKPIRFEWNDVRDVDNNWNFSDHANAQLNAQMGSLRRQLALDIDALLVANAGIQMNGAATKRVTVTDASKGVIQPVGMWEIEQDFADGGFTSPFIVGSKEVFQWKKALGIATDNNTTGQDYAKLSDSQMYYDTVLNSVAGDTSNGEHIIAFDPQALKFVTYNENLGIFATDLNGGDLDAMFKRGTTDYAFGVIADPETGLLWDIYVNYDKCDKAFDIHLKLQWDIFFPKMQHCNIQGVNGIFHYRTCPVVLAPCPSGTSPVSPVASKIYSWTPGSIYPLYINESLIGGVHNHPNVNVTTIAELADAMNDAYGAAIFSVSGSTIRYTGYSAISVNLNNGGVTGTFA